MRCFVIIIVAILVVGMTPEEYAAWIRSPFVYGGQVEIFLLVMYSSQRKYHMMSYYVSESDVDRIRHTSCLIKGTTKSMQDQHRLR